MKNKNWKKIKNSVDFIALTKSGTKNLVSNDTTCRTSLPTSQKPCKVKKSKWPLLKHTVTAVYYFLRGLIINLRISTTVSCVTYVSQHTHQIKPRQEEKSKTSKWKMIGNSLYFINLSKKCAEESKVTEGVEEMNKNTVFGTEDYGAEKAAAKIKARSRWKLLQNTFLVVHFLLRIVVNHLKLNW